MEATWQQVAFVFLYVHLFLMPSTKKHITSLVRFYIKQNPEEWETFKKGIEMTRQFTKDEFATLYGSHDTRALFDMPEKLYEMFVMGLDEEEMQWFKTKRGAHWFARNFPAFALPQQI